MVARIFSGFYCRKPSSFFKENLVPLGKLLERVTDHHGNKFPILHEVRTVYQRFASTLIAHLFREEEELFPFIKKMYRLAAEKRTMAPPYFGSIEQLEFSLSKEHADTGNELALLRELTNILRPRQVLVIHLKEFMLF
jgi:regulator of cell morphogenesis and NO signaling